MFYGITQNYNLISLFIADDSVTSIHINRSDHFIQHPL